MAGRRRGRYPPEYRERIVELARAGRSPGSLAREFEPAEQTIRNWIRQADLDEGLRSDGLTTEARKEMRELKREVKRLRMERDILKKPRPGSRGRADRSPAGVCVHEGAPGHLPACGHVPGAGSLLQRVLRLAAASALGGGRRRDAELKGRIVAHWIESRETYGCPRIHAALLAEGHRVSRKRVARLMGELGIKGVTRRRYKPGTTKRDPRARPAPDLVNRDFSAAGPDRLWMADITQVRTGTGRLYLAVVLDAWSRRIVGWAMESRMPADLVGDALTMAITCRQPKGPVIHHSDQGSQYTSLAFGQRCREAGDRAVDGLGRRRVRQRDVRELLRDARVRTPGPAVFSDDGRGKARGLQLHRRLLQHPPSPLRARLQVARELRETQPCGLKRTCSPRAAEALRASPDCSLRPVRS